MSRFEKARLKKMNSLKENDELSLKQVEDLMLKWTKKYIKDAEYRRAYYQKNKETIKAKEKEYRKKNRERILIKKKEYRERKKEDIKKYKTNYYKKNRNNIRDKIKCEVCGAIVRKDNFARHCRTKKHQKHLISMVDMPEEVTEITK